MAMKVLKFLFNSLHFIQAAALIFLSSYLFNFLDYEEVFKRISNLKTAEVTYTHSMSDFGFALFFFGALIHKKLGINRTLFAATLIFFLCNIFFYFIVHHRFFPSSLFSYMILIFFINLSNGFYYISSLLSQINNLSNLKHFGKLIGVLNFIFFLGATTFSFLFTFHTNKSVICEGKLENSNHWLQFFLLFIPFVIILFNIFGVCIFGVYNDKRYKTPDVEYTRLQIQKNSEEVVTLRERSFGVSYVALFRTFDFWLFVIVFGIAFGNCSYYVKNFLRVLNTYGHAGMGIVDRWFMVGTYLTISFVCLIFGFLMDYISMEKIRFRLYLLIILVVNALVQLLMIFLVGYYWFEIVCLVINAVMFAVLFILMQFYVLKLFGIQSFGENFGIFFFFIYCYQIVLNNLLIYPEFYNYIGTCLISLVALGIIFFKIKVPKKSGNVKKK